MRMDRYNENDTTSEVLKTRTNKNQELYTDVYMNNVYVDINNLKNVMKEDDEKTVDLKLVKENKVIDYTYEDKIYNINTLIEEAIKNSSQDNLKRSIDTKVDDMEIDSLIESINENKESEKKSNDLLLTDLMPSNDNTSVIPPLEEPILETLNNELEKIDEKASTLEEKVDLEEEKLEKEILDIKEETEIIEKAKNEIVEISKKEEVKEETKNNEIEEEFIFEEKSRGKVVLIILITILIIAITVFVLLYKHII